MRKILVLSMMAALSLTSCLKGYEDNFSESSSERINEAIEQAAKVLAGAQNGWRMEVYPNPTCDYGGYTVFAKFDGEQVTAMGEIFGPEVVSTSYYSITAENGPMLSFDTYNDVIHFFSDPSYGAQYGYGEAQYGLHGDSDFIVMSAEPDCVVLKGRVTGNKVRMYPIDAATDWAAEMEQYIDMADRMSLNYNRASIDGEDIAELFYESEYQGFTSRYFIFINDAGDEIHGPYIITKNGLKFYEPVTLGSHTVSEMTLVDDWYLSSDDGAVNIYSPEPIRSDNTFSIQVTGITYMAATAIVTPSNNDGYYFDLYPKAAIANMNDRSIINDMLGSLNSYIPTYTPEFVYEALASFGVDGYEFTGLSPETDYVVVAFGVSVSNEGDRLVSTTGLTKYEFRTADMPELDANYEKWLGSWVVTSTSSLTSRRPLSMSVEIGVKIPNESVTIQGLTIQVLRNYTDLSTVVAQFNAANGRITIANMAPVGANGADQLYHRGYFINGTSMSMVNGTFNSLTGTLSGNNAATLVGASLGLTDGSTITIAGSEIFATDDGGASWGYYGPATGFTSGDWPIGPYTLTKVASYSANTEKQPQTRAAANGKVQPFKMRRALTGAGPLSKTEIPVEYWSSYEAF